VISTITTTGYARDTADRRIVFPDNLMSGETMMATANAQRLVHLEQGMADDGHLAPLPAKARQQMAAPARA
jgi:hypothetical protein